MVAVAREPPGPLVFRRPALYQAQYRAVYAASRYAVIEASTKSGKTVACLAWLAERAFLARRPGQHYWWIAPGYAQAKMAFRRQKRSLPRERYEPNESELTLTYGHNGAVQQFRSAENPDSLYGEDVFAAVIDEATRCKEDAWLALRTTLTATQGPVRIIGNVKGRKNWAYRLARKAEAGEPGYAYAKITAYDAVQAGVLDPEEIEDARRALPGSVFQELYLAEASDDGGNPFGLAAIRRKVLPELAPGPPVVWGWDLAKSVDYTVGIALNARGQVCRFERWQGAWELTIAKIISLSRCRAVVDTTGVGDPVFEALQRRGAGVFEPYKFTAQSKQQLMEGLAVAIQQGESGLGYPAGTIVSELEGFEYEYRRPDGVRYSAPDGAHDDCVIALALAWHGFRRRAMHQAMVPPSTSYQSL
jgi:hypothetical protein